jgi:hypothetical protein
MESWSNDRAPTPDKPSSSREWITCRLTKWQVHQMTWHLQIIKASSQPHKKGLSFEQLNIWSNDIPNQASFHPLVKVFFSIWPNGKLIKCQSTYTFKQADIPSLKDYWSLYQMASWSNNTALTQNQASSNPLWVFVSWQNDKLIKWDSTNTQSSMLPSPRESILCHLTKWHSHSLMTLS